MLRRRATIALVIALASNGAVILTEIVQPSAYLQAELWLRDTISRDGRMAKTNPNLIFLAIDNDSITLDPTLDVRDLFSSAPMPADSGRALQLMAQGWPWNREVYALVLDRLIGAGAKAVVFDCFFAKAGPGDDKLRVALDRYGGHAVIGSNFVTASDVRFTRQTPSRYDLPTSSIVPASALPDPRIGFTNFFVDDNHVVRGAQYQIAFRDGRRDEATYLSLAAQAAVDAGRRDAIPPDLSEHLIRFAGAPGLGFKPHSIYEIFVPEYWAHNYASGETFRNKIVIVGGQGSWQKDELMTPFGMMPGAELHLNALNALLAHDFLSQLSIPITAALILLSGLGAAILCLVVDSPWTRLIATLAANGLILATTLLLYNSAGILVPALGCAMACNSVVAIQFLCDLGFERLEKRRLKTTLKVRQDLTNMIVHDLRSPLTIVTGYMGMLQNTANEKLGQNESQFVNAALSGANRMSDMITTLLDVERLESGQMPLRFSECNLGELIEQTGARFAPVLGLRTIEYAGSTDGVVIDCDPDVIRRVIENLVNNSIKYTRPDGRIEISVILVDEHVTMCVADDGVGIPIDQRERIFEKFGQVDGGGKHRHSTGLGLTFCRLAVEGHGGRIWVDEPKLGGSTFVFTLPIRPAQIEPTSLQSKSPLSSQRI
jgi:signal transduction histidine kinase